MRQDLFVQRYSRGSLRRLGKTGGERPHKRLSKFDSFRTTRTAGSGKPEMVPFCIISFMITPPLTCDPGRADRVNLPRVLSSHEEATVRCAKARPGSNSSAGFPAPVRPKTSGPHASNSILPTVPVFIDRCGGAPCKTHPICFRQLSRPACHKTSFRPGGPLSRLSVIRGHH
jgi:hypothetical protein